MKIHKNKKVMDIFTYSENDTNIFFLLRVFKALVIVCIQHKCFSILVEKYSMSEGRWRKLSKKVFLICLEGDIDSSNIYPNKKYYGYTFKA